MDFIKEGLLQSTNVMLFFNFKDMTLVWELYFLGDQRCIYVVTTICILYPATVPCSILNANLLTLKY